MNEIEDKILKALYLLENEKEKFSDEKFLKYCETVETNIIKAFKEGNFTKDEAKPLLNRVNKLLDMSEEKTITHEYEADTKICPKCDTKNIANANFCRKCGHSLK